MAGYTRQSAAAISTGLIIRASDINAEFDAIEDAFNASTGHAHDGTTGDGPKIVLTTSVSGLLPIANGGTNASTEATARSNLSIDDIAIKQSKLDATTAPTVSNDNTEGYGVGSVWIDITNDVKYDCVDASTGAAVWLSGSGITDITNENIGDLLDVVITSVADGHILIYDGVTDNRWENRALVAGDIPDLSGTYQPLAAVLTATTASFTTALETKLSGIEASATADQSDSEIETAYNNQVAAASQVEMEAGTEAGIRRMSPLRVSQAIAALSSGASQLSELSDVGVTTPTNKNALMADGDSWESRPLVEADISDFGSYAALSHTHLLADITDSGTMAAQNSTSISVTGGNIDGVAIGGTTPAQGEFTKIIAGDAGFEGTGITVGGVTYESSAKVSDIGGTNVAQFILHRHSTTLAPIIVGARSNSDTSSHGLVTNGQDLLSIYAVGWDGTDYAIGAQILFEVDGTAGAGDMPTSIDFRVSADGTEAPASALKIRQDGSIEVASTVDGRDLAVDGTKLDGIESLADVTDATNVAAAGAVMDSDFSVNGIMVRTASGTYTNRTITASTGVQVTNGDGVSGNPTVALSHLGFESLTDPNADSIPFWDDGAGSFAWLATYRGLEINGTELRSIESFVIACSDETTDLTTGTAKVTFRMPYAFTVTDVRASVNTAPVGATITVDINEGGGSILSTKLTIDASGKTSETAATPAVISDSSLADDAEITIDIDQVGSTTAGKGLKVVLIGYQT